MLDALVDEHPRYRSARRVVEQHEQSGAPVRCADVGAGADRGGAGLQRLQLAEIIALLDRQRRARNGNINVAATTESISSR
mgnify:CR=1 FL=1